MLNTRGVAVMPPRHGSTSFQLCPLPLERLEASRPNHAVKKGLAAAKLTNSSDSSVPFLSVSYLAIAPSTSSLRN